MSVDVVCPTKCRHSEVILVVEETNRHPRVDTPEQVILRPLFGRKDGQRTNHRGTGRT